MSEEHRQKRRYFDTVSNFKDLKGMTGTLKRDEADVAVTIMAQCCDRENVIDIFQVRKAEYERSNHALFPPGL